MVRCATCEKKIGAFDLKWQHIEGGKHCSKCVPIALARRCAKVKDTILAAPAPQVILMAPVISSDLDNPVSNCRYIGTLMFTDKGVIFAQQGELKQSQNGAMLFGLVGGIYSAIVESGRRKKAFATLDDIDSEDERALIDQAEQLFFFKMGDIMKLKGSKSCFKFKLTNGRPMVFRWAEGKKAIKPHLPLLDTYAQAVNDSRDVMTDCKALTQS